MPDSEPQLPRRRRNVISRNRTGCFTCRRRHLRCDEGKPACHNCVRLNLTCEGYGARIAFKDQTSTVTEKAKESSSKPKRQRRQQKAIAGGSEDVAAVEEETVSPPSPKASPIVSTHPVENQVTGTASQAWPSPNFETQLFYQPSGYYSAITKQEPSAEIVGERIHRPSMALTHIDTSIPSPISWPETPSSVLDCRDLVRAAKEEDTNTNTFPTDSTWALKFGASPIPLSPLSVSSIGHNAFCFSEDSIYYQHLFGRNSSGLFKIIPLQDLIAEGPEAAHLHSAMLALSALNFSNSSEIRSQGLSNKVKNHSLHHYIAALQGMRQCLAVTNNRGIPEFNSMDTLLSWFLTSLLLANFDLQRGSLVAWRAHLKAAAVVLGTSHDRLFNSNVGRMLAQAFSRMSLLLELHNDEFAVTNLSNMNPGVVEDLKEMLNTSDSPKDRLLRYIKDIGKIELKYRYKPSLEKWAHKMDKIAEQLTEWQSSLPASELPVDNGIQPPVIFQDETLDPNDPLATVSMSPLTFPNAEDPYNAAVNYAHFLCARMRARTRYLHPVGRVVPEDTESTVLTVCRIAAGIPPALCSELDAYGHGMMPAVVGAYRWTNQEWIRKWIYLWLAGYETTREGIWNVSQTRRLMPFLEKEIEKRNASGQQWEVIAVRIEDEMGEGTIDEETKGNAPFKIVMHARTPTGFVTEYCMVE